MERVLERQNEYYPVLWETVRNRKKAYSAFRMSGTTTDSSWLGVLLDGLCVTVLRLGS